MTAKERVVVRGNRSEKEVWSLWSEEACLFFSIWLWCVHLVLSWNECHVSNVPLCLCLVSDGRKEARASIGRFLRLRIFQ